MKRILVSVIIGLVAATLCHASDILSNMAAGVPGVAWGEKLAQRADMVWNDNEKYFSRKKEDLSLPLPDKTVVPLANIWYYTDAQGGFSSCIVFAPGSSMNGLSLYVQKRYGDPVVAGGRNTVYVWRSGLLILGKGFDGTAALTIKRPQQIKASPAK